MATESALCGIGVPAQLAELLGQEPATIAGAGATSQTNAAVLKSQMAELTVADSSHNSFILVDVGLANEVYVVNSSSTAALVYPPVGQSMNGSSNASFSVAQWKPCTFIQYKKGFWAAQLSA